MVYTVKHFISDFTFVRAILNFNPAELRPLTDRAVTTYGSHGDCDEYGGDISDGGRVESDFVIIVSDCEDPEPCECDVVSGERAQGQLRVPSSRSGGILKTRHKPEVRERGNELKTVCQLPSSSSRPPPATIAEPR